MAVRKWEQTELIIIRNSKGRCSLWAKKELRTMKINSLHFFSLLSLVVFPGCWSREKPHGLNNQCHKTLVSDTHSYSHRTHSHVRSRCTVVAASRAGDMSLFYHAVHNLGICQKICPCWSFFFSFFISLFSCQRTERPKKIQKHKELCVSQTPWIGPSVMSEYHTALQQERWVNEL